MLTVLENPSDYNFSKSPVICEISTDNMYTSPVTGTKAKGMYTFTVGVAVGAFIEIITPTTTLHLDFISYTNPPTVGKLRTRNPADSFTNYWNKIESDLLLNSYISSNYTVTQDGLGAFTLDAINTGEQYSLHNSLYNGLGINFINYFNGTDDIPSLIKTNYEVRVELFVQKFKNSPTYESIVVVKKQPYTTQKVKFDLSAIIDSCLDYYFPIPGLTIPILCINNCKRFFVQIKEFFGDPSTQQVVTINPSGILESDGYSTLKGDILKAGISPIWNNQLPKIQLESYVWDRMMFLTTRNRKINIKKNQPEYLFFCLSSPVSTEDVQLKIVKKYNDGTPDITQYSPIYNGVCNTASVLCFPVNYSGSIFDTTFDLNNQAAYKMVVSVVAQEYQNINLSEEIEYYLNYEPINDDRIFLFTNSLSGVDTLRTSGNYENNTEFEKEVSTRLWNLSDAKHLGTNSESKNYKKETFIAFTGWKKLDDLKWIDDLFLAKYKVEVLPNNIYAPITITSSKYKKHATNQNLYGIEIEYYHQLKSEVTDKLAFDL